ncbi:MAG: conjugal transfer protein TraF [Gammaproteobacteria bacterium]|nr:conjugal transfer protein TraF [Gammaproteobacteria bacterium]MDH5778296.1 conjugal transfer protein TraF [Gammaproteobacteria bacterium]
MLKIEQTDGRLHQYIGNLGLLSMVAMLLIPVNAQAFPFGIYDPRSMAMGGTGVASANSITSVFYNPALLALEKKRKEKSGKQSFSFPLVAARRSNSVETILDLNDVNYTNQITSTVNDYNAARTTETALAALNEFRNFNGSLGEIANKPLFADANTSLVIGIPSNQEGGAFYVTGRAVGDGQVNVPAEEQQLLADYTEALEFITSGGASGEAHPELFDGGGNLINPVGNITANANARGAVITETGVSFSKRVSNTPFIVGFTPKVMTVKTYDVSKSLNSAAIDRQPSENSDPFFSLDVGFLYKFDNTWRGGMVIKNLREKSYVTNLGNTIKIQPQIRLGVARITSSLILSLDYDIAANKGVYSENKTQYLALGAELPLGVIKFRGGYRHTMKANGPKESGVFSAGLGLQMSSLYFDLAYATNSDQEGASLILGFQF